MKIAFFSTKPYDKIWFEPMGKEYGFEIHFYEMAFQEETITLAGGFDAVCIFVNDYVNAKMVQQLYEMGVRAILLRSAGFNHVDVKAEAVHSARAELFAGGGGRICHRCDIDCQPIYT